MRTRMPYVLLLLLTMQACTCQQVSSEGALMQFIMDEENGVVKSNEANHVKTTLRYRPHDLLVLQEMSGEKYDETTILEVKNKYKDYQYFTLSFSLDEKNLLYAQNSQQDFSSVLQILSFKMDKYVYGKIDGEEIPLADFQFSRMYGKSTETMVLLAFENKIKEDNSLKIIVEEFGLGTGNQEFEIKGKNLLQVPDLAFKKILI